MRVPPTEAEESLCFSEDVEGEAVCPRQVRKKGRGSKTQMPQSVGRFKATNTPELLDWKMLREFSFDR